jgi:hypothetical protein
MSAKNNNNNKNKNCYIKLIKSEKTFGISWVSNNILLKGLSYEIDLENFDER